MATYLSILLVVCAVLVALGGATSLERSLLKSIPSDKERGELLHVASFPTTTFIYHCSRLLPLFTTFTNCSPPPPNLRLALPA